MADSMDDESNDDSEATATLTSIHQADALPVFGGEGYEPWLFQTMLNELSERELGVGFIYSILELFATRHGLTDVAVVLVNESFGTQMFRLGGASVTPDMAAHLNSSPCAPRANWRCRCTWLASAPPTIRSPTLRIAAASTRPSKWPRRAALATAGPSRSYWWTCLLYTSDAADDLLCVDLG